MGQTLRNGSSPDSSLIAEDKPLLLLVVPPLQTFLEKAELSPTVSRAKAYQEEQEHRLNVTKKEWMNYIRANSNYSYGSMGSMTETSATGQGTYFQYFGEEMSLYNIGGSVTIPLDLFFGRKDRIKANQSQIEQAKHQVEQTIEDRKLVITQVYAELVANLRMLKITAGAFTVAETNVKLGEMEYANNNITLQELSGRHRDQTLAAASYEETKSNLYTSVRHLELITGIKLIP
jgi:outer membrane protein TolC